MIFARCSFVRTAAILQLGNANYRQCLPCASKQQHFVTDKKVIKHSTHKPIVCHFFQPAALTDRSRFINADKSIGQSIGLRKLR